MDVSISLHELQIIVKDGGRECVTFLSEKNMYFFIMFSFCYIFFKCSNEIE